MDSHTTIQYISFGCWKASLQASVINRGGIDSITRCLQHCTAIFIWFMDNIEQIGDNYLEKEEWDLLRKTYGFYSRLGRERC
jgi:hypothetical protein